MEAEKRLLAAITERAWKDALNMRTVSAQDKADAISWIRGEGSAAEWMCDQLDMDVEVLRARLEAKLGDEDETVQEAPGYDH